MTVHNRVHCCACTQPTNNLDLEAVVALADAVESFEGGVVVVSVGAPLRWGGRGGGYWLFVMGGCTALRVRAGPRPQSLTRGL